MEPHTQVRKWRNTRRYRNARKEYLSENPFCAYCSEAGFTVGADELDHIVSAYKRPDLFWDRSNWQGLCKPCHKYKSDHEKRRIVGATLEGDLVEHDTKNGSRVTLVGGSVGSGKTTWVQRNKTPGDLVLDMDTIWHCLMGGVHYPQPLELLPFVFDVRDAILKRLRMSEYLATGWVSRAWIISAQPDRALFDDLAQSIKARTMILNTPRIVCLARCAGRDYPARPPRTWTDLVNEWHDTFQTLPHDRVVDYFEPEPPSKEADHES